MKKFKVVYRPAILVSIEVEAETEDQAIDIAENKISITRTLAGQLYCGKDQEFINMGEYHFEEARQID